MKEKREKKKGKQTKKLRKGCSPNDLSFGKRVLYIGTEVVYEGDKNTRRGVELCFLFLLLKSLIRSR